MVLPSGRPDLTHFNVKGGTGPYITWGINTPTPNKLYIIISRPLAYNKSQSINTSLNSCVHCHLYDHQDYKRDYMNPINNMQMRKLGKTNDISKSIYTQTNYPLMTNNQREIPSILYILFGCFIHQPEHT